MSEVRTDGSRPDSDDRLRQLVALLTTQPLHGAQPEPLVRFAAAAVPAADGASMSLLGLEERLRTLAATDRTAATLDVLQLECGEGPALAAVETTDVVHAPDLADEQRWPRFAGPAVATGAQSVLALSSELEHGDRVALTFYARTPRAFSELDIDIACVAGWLVATALQAVRQRERAANLEIALETNRHIGSAIGILMARELLTADQAFERLRDASQRLHRKLRDVATEVINTGQLPDVPAGSG